MSSADKFKELGLGTTEESTAKAIDRLSTDEKIKLMSVLFSKREVRQYALVFNVAEELKYKWLKQYADDSLALHCSHKGRARRDVVDAIKAVIEQSRIKGALGKAGDFLTGGG